ncbi:basic amino acid/polyamine antiporter [Lactococcus termiticola]|uniref:Arginine/ornithine antiporter n=1 Tax=Lactococcus termiticola TaxID=2169526 RepID=A0A2R5HHJ8_9LACT|nr:basic amino acid/polyamine antiporter [Lactococcus termiticola]GBG97537.1 arginine/ornithine antiporter [Lactococcus termiticola]
MENKKGIGLFALVAIIVSGAIGGGVFNLSNDLATGATPGGVVISWLVIGFGILMLVLSLNHLVVNKPELSGVSDYARAGFGNMVGFISGWGYWLSAWAGNIAFAVLMMTSVDYFFPGVFQDKNGSMTILSVIIVSLVSWGLTALVLRGVEGAAVINAIVLIAKLIPLAVFGIAGIVMFKAGVFTAHFWQNFVANTDADGVIKSLTFSNMTGSDLFGQVKGSLLVMIWVFVGIEGAAMMGDRAKRKSDAGKASILGLIALLVIYLLLSLLPFGFMSQQELANTSQPGLVHILNAMVGGWGGSLMAIGLVISLLGAWLSWTMLPVEATQQLSDQKLLPSWFGKLNKNNAPANSLLLTQFIVQIFLIVTYFVADAYNVFVYLCTAVIMICYALVGLYLLKLGFTEKKVSNVIIGFIAAAFQILALYFSGWQFVWLSLILYAVGFILYALGKQEYGGRWSAGELISAAVLTILGILAIFGVYGNWLGLEDALGIDGNTLLIAVVPLIIVTIIVFFIIKADVKKKMEAEV